MPQIKNFLTIDWLEIQKKLTWKKLSSSVNTAKNFIIQQESSKSIFFNFQPSQTAKNVSIITVNDRRWLSFMSMSNEHLLWSRGRSMTFRFEVKTYRIGAGKFNFQKLIAYRITSPLMNRLPFNFLNKNPLPNWKQWINKSLVT